MDHMPPLRPPHPGSNPTLNPEKNPLQQHRHVTRCAFVNTAHTLGAGDVRSLEGGSTPPCVSQCRGFDRDWIGTHTRSHLGCLQQVSRMMWGCVSAVKFDIMCGVPYTALPISTCMSLGFNMPMVMRRKEVSTCRRWGTHLLYVWHRLGACMAQTWCMFANHANDVSGEPE